MTQKNRESDEGKAKPTFGKTTPFFCPPPPSTAFLCFYRVSFLLPSFFWDARRSLAAVTTPPPPHRAIFMGAPVSTHTQQQLPSFDLNVALVPFSPPSFLLFLSPFCGAPARHTPPLAKPFCSPPSCQPHSSRNKPRTQKQRPQSKSKVPSPFRHPKNSRFQPHRPSGRGGEGRANWRTLSTRKPPWGDPPENFF
jgi:hypothetical protein